MKSIERNLIESQAVMQVHQCYHLQIKKTWMKFNVYRRPIYPGFDPRILKRSRKIAVASSAVILEAEGGRGRVMYSNESDHMLTSCVGFVWEKLAKIC
jgi:hypothetical protein